MTTFASSLVAWFRYISDLTIMGPRRQTTIVIGLGLPGDRSLHPLPAISRSRSFKTYCNIRIETTNGRLVKESPLWKHFVGMIKGTYSVVNYLFTNLYEPSTQIQRARIELQRFDIELKSLTRRVDEFEKRMIPIESKLREIETNPQIGSGLQLEAMRETNKALIKDLQHIQEGLRFSGTPS